MSWSCLRDSWSVGNFIKHQKCHFCLIDLSCEKVLVEQVVGFCDGNKSKTASFTFTSVSEDGEETSRSFDKVDGEYVRRR